VFSGGSPTVVNISLLDQNRLFLSSSSSLIVTRLSGPLSRPTASRKFGSAGNRTQDLWVSNWAVKLLVMEFSPPSCHFIPLRSNYTPQQNIPKQSVFL
jgi:hypothetical protein